jgi:elongation factor P hydroxylase
VESNVSNKIIWFAQQQVSSGIESLGHALEAGQERQEHEVDI